MLKIILSGAGGAMGRVVAGSVERRDGFSIVAGIDPFAPGAGKNFPIYAKASECTQPADVLVDFSNPAGLDELLAYALDRKLPLVLATTGLDKNQVARVHAAAEKIPVFYSGNMSLGVNLMREIARFSTRILGDICDIEIVERHHNKKIDAPSGAALMLADAISEELKEPPLYQYERHSTRERRTKNEIGIHSVRGGTIVGDHEIIFAGLDEVLTISHSAGSKEIFATGALSATAYLVTQGPGIYDMNRLMQQHGVARMEIQQNISLVTLRNIPIDKNLMVEIFDRFAQKEVGIDMISQANPMGENISISFTYPLDCDDKVMALTKELQADYPDIRSMISSNGCKIVLSGSEMKDSPGVFSRVVAALAPTPAEIQSVSTAETEISLVVASEHLTEAVAALKAAFKI